MLSQVQATTQIRRINEEIVPSYNLEKNTVFSSSRILSIASDWFVHSIFSVQ